MLNDLKHKFQGFLIGIVFTIVVGACLIGPHTTFHTSFGNMPASQQVAEDQSVSLAAMLPAVKPVVPAKVK